MILFKGYLTFDRPKYYRDKQIHAREYVVNEREDLEDDHIEAPYQPGGDYDQEEPEEINNEEGLINQMSQLGSQDSNRFHTPSNSQQTSAQSIRSSVKDFKNIFYVCSPRSFDKSRDKKSLKKIV